MPTRNEPDGSAAGDRAGRGLRGRPPDPEQEMALVASANRELLLRAHRYRLRPEDLEDCYSQATLEMLLRIRRGGAFASRRHALNALEQRFVSRIHDRRRALAGRSPMQAAIESASRLEHAPDHHFDIEDRRAALEQLVLNRIELHRIQTLARELTRDQRLVLATQIGLQMPAAEFCRRYGWSAEKYRKVAQRARARLRSLVLADDGTVPACGAASDERAGPAYEPDTSNS